MHYRDLRGWLEGVDSFGELRIVEGADWNQEIGAVAEVAAQSQPPPAVLFDKIKDYPAGRRVLTGVHNPTLKRQCLTNHLPLDYTRDQFIDAWKKRLDNPKLIPPRAVDSGPVLENIFEGKDIDLAVVARAALARGRRRALSRLARYHDQPRSRRRLDQSRLLSRDDPRSRYARALYVARSSRQHSPAKIFRQGPAVSGGDQLRPRSAALVLRPNGDSRGTVGIRLRRRRAR